MKLLSVLVMGCLLSVAAVAAPGDRIAEKADRIAMELRYRGHELSQSQREQINKSLDSIRRVLDGDLEGPGGGGDSRYTCVSRDNDGRAPYSLAIREGINVTRLQITYDTLPSCEQAMNLIRYIGYKGLICTSRDNDGREPTLLALLNGGQAARISKTVMNKADCLETLRTLRPDRNNNIVMCVSRDADGRNPYVALNLNMNNGSVQTGTETFNNIADCKKFIGQ
ncbi:hypothetical protein [Bdellovibrio sp. KM01]|uniref:hypothetical protein n=1 Tax=Bdellovibrio sp. KM01 TaxID=2748865 RepID=UPI0015E953C4|nr:hypothetical protein [Bdellovibrio sp. KM01]QLY24545.1 hypothetical protein HW988_13925 [Bdellovibrio sp. KM01]